MNKRLLAGLAAAGIIGGGVYGFAASLDVNSDTVGADDDAVAACDLDTLDVDYTVDWSATIGDYVVDDVIVTKINDACVGDKIGVTLEAGSTDTELTQQDVVSNPSVAADDNTNTFDALGSNVSAKLVEDVHVVIAG